MAPQIAKHRGARCARAAISDRSPRPGGEPHAHTRCSARSCSAPAPTACSTSRTRPCLLLPDQALLSAVRRADRRDGLRPIWSARRRRSSPARSTAVQRELSRRDGAGLERARLRARRAAARPHRGALLVQGSEEINPRSVKEADVFADRATAGQACVQVFFFRAGRTGATTPSSRRPTSRAAGEVLEAFIAQFYDGSSLRARSG